VFYKAHEGGGHFAAMEMPEELWDDVESFIQKALPSGLSNRL
jgi:microsomal epoxide hydrolase